MVHDELCTAGQLHASGYLACSVLLKIISSCALVCCAGLKSQQAPIVSKKMFRMSPCIMANMPVFNQNTQRLFKFTGYISFWDFNFLFQLLLLTWFASTNSIIQPLISQASVSVSSNLKNVFAASSWNGNKVATFKESPSIG